MNISDVNATNPHRSGHLRNNDVGKTGAGDPSAQGSSSAESREAGDRVEISDRARTALQDARKAEDLNFARKALDNVPSMSEERVAELMNRIKTGYYQRQDVIDQVAKRAGNELASGI